MMSLDGYLIASPQVRASRGASRGPTEQAERHGEREPRSKISAVVSASLENRCPQRRGHSEILRRKFEELCMLYDVFCRFDLDPKAERDLRPHRGTLHSDRLDHMSHDMLVAPLVPCVYVLFISSQAYVSGRGSRTKL